MTGSVTLKRLSLWQRFLGFVFPCVRRARDRRGRNLMKWLVTHPEVRVHFED
jgi:hypothetical protein